jgi:ankyrin repeat protein
MKGCVVMMTTQEFLDLCAAGELHEVEVAIKDGADVNVRDDGLARTCLAYSVEDTDPEDISFFRERGADVNVTKGDEGGKIVRVLAAWNKPTPQVASLFDFKIKDGKTALMYAAENAHHPEVTALLLKNGADVNAKDEGSKTALTWAAWSNSSTEIIALLLKNGAYVDARDDCGDTPLMFAAYENPNPEIISLLLENGADVNARNYYQEETALISAAINNRNPEIVSLLLENGADAHMEDYFGKRAIDYAEENDDLKDTEVISNLRKMG